MMLRKCVYRTCWSTRRISCNFAVQRLITHFSTQQNETNFIPPNVKFEVVKEKKKKQVNKTTKKPLQPKEKKDEEEPELSKSKQFKKIPVLPEIVQEILSVGPVRKPKEYRKEDEEEEIKKKSSKETKPSLDMQCEEHVNWVFQAKMRQVKLATTWEELPPENPQYPEVAFAGRSNVGKSSLINAVLKRHNLVVSDRPGETKALSFYKIGKCLRMVDLPGYGFAYAKEEDVENWIKVTRRYLKERKSLKCIYVLIDSRHGLKTKDLEMLNFLEE